MITCPKCQQRGGTWTVQRIPHTDERAIECPSCGTVVTETFLRDVQGMAWPGVEA